MLRKPKLSSSAIWKVSAVHEESPEQKVGANELVMAWAKDKDSNKPVYILELGEHQRGAGCNCVCVSCELPLVAVNAAKVDYQQRPHFRHPVGAERKSCLVLAARYAVAQQLFEEGFFQLPRIRRSATVEGLSGQVHQAWVELPPENVHITDVSFRDKATALLSLDDGRQIIVELTGGYSEQSNQADTITPTISLNITDPAIASMAPDELRKRLKLLWAGACWHNYWPNAELTEKATALARQQASESLDWLDGTDAEDYAALTPTQKKETLLHREVKAILEQEKRIHLPELKVTASREGVRNPIETIQTSWPAEFVTLSSVVLEKRYGRLIPDVIATVVDPSCPEGEYQLLVEVTVTNPINEERRARIRAENLPTLEIDIGRMGGLVTREELINLVVHEIAGKGWVHHPKSILELMKFNAELDAEHEYHKQRRRRRMSDDLTLEECAKNYLRAIYIHGNRRSGQEEQDVKSERKALDLVEDYAQALSIRGYHEAKDSELYLYRGNIIERLLSIQLDKGVGYQLGTGWQVINAIHQEDEKKWSWHTLYLIAIKVYKPKLSEDNLRSVQHWNQTAWSSLQRAEKKFKRDNKYDRLLGLLFPEMKELLGAGSGIWEPTRKQSKQYSSNSNYSDYRRIKG